MRASLWLDVRFLSRAAYLGIIALSLGSPSRADTLFLQHGGRLEGELLNPEQSPRRDYQLQTRAGIKVTLPASLVDRAVVLSEAERKYEAFAAKLPDTAAAHWDAAERCARAHLGEKRTFHLEQVVRLDPEHAEARRALGYSRLDGRWTKQEEFMEQKGLVRAGGAWRLPQELELLAQKQALEDKEVQLRKELLRWRDWIVNSRRDPQKAAQAVELIRGIQDPMAAGPLVELLRKEKEPQALRLLYLEVLAKLDVPASLVMYVRLPLEDPSPTIRERCLDVLEKSRPKAAVREFMKQLRSPENVVVNRAALALERIKDPEATPALIEALRTTHKFLEGGGGITPSFSGDGSAGLSMGGSPKAVKKVLENKEVLRALNSIHPGVNFGYDQARWKAWYVQQNMPKAIVSLRRDE